MALTKTDREEIGQLFQAAVSEGKAKEKDKYKLTEKRLYAYQILKRNIERHKLDIEDIKKEDIRKSKDIVLYSTCGGSGEKLELEELRAAKILVVKQKISRDEKEIAEINAALKEIEKDEYFEVIKDHYFNHLSQDEIAEKMTCDKVTVWRNKKKLVRIISLILYGADAI